jgi:hypothetical protein
MSSLNRTAGSIDGTHDKAAGRTKSIIVVAVLIGESDNLSDKDHCKDTLTWHSPAETEYIFYTIAYGPTRSRARGLREDCDEMT